MAKLAHKKRGRPSKNKSGLPSIQRSYRFDPDFVAEMDRFVNAAGENQTRLIEDAVKRYLRTKAKP